MFLSRATGSLGQVEHGSSTLRTSGIALLIGALMLSGCKTRGGPIAYGSADFRAPDQLHTALPADQLIAPLDKLSITVFRVPELSATHQVSVGGQLDMPLIGQVTAVNMTPAQLAQELENLYGTKFLRDPDISVSIAESQTSTVSIDGGVNRPGMFPIPGGTDLMSAIALGGGLSEDGNPRRVAIFRKIDGATQAAAFDLQMVREGKADNPPVYPGDIIYVDSAGAPPWFRDFIQGASLLAVFSRL